MGKSPEGSFEAIIAPMTEEFRIHQESPLVGDDMAAWDKLRLLGYEEADILEMLGFGEQ